MSKVGACCDCGELSDGLMTCTYAHDGSTTELCPKCITNSGFCYGCGYYGAGSSDFWNNYCGNCHSEIDEDDDFDEPIENWGGYDDPELNPEL